MADLRKTGEGGYEVLVDKQSIGQVWNWHSRAGQQRRLGRLTSACRAGRKP